MKTPNDSASNSGLFDTETPKSTKSSTPKPKRSGKRAGSDQRIDSQQVKSKESGAKQVESAESVPSDDKIPQAFIISELDLTDQKAVYIAIKSTKADNALIYQLAKVIVDGYKKRERPTTSRAREDLLTGDQVAHIISDTLKAGYESGNLTGADAKGLTAVLQQLLPDLFGIGDDESKPDPIAVITYLCTWSGMSGADIVKDIGGPEFVADQLSKALDMRVRLG